MMSLLDDRKKMTEGTRVLSVSLLLLLVSFPLFASDGWYNSSGYNLLVVVSQIRISLLTLLKYLLVIGSAGALVFAIFSMIKGEQEAASRFAIWLVGLLIGFTLLTVVGNVSNSKLQDMSSVASGSNVNYGFYEIKSALKDVVCILLSIVSMITVVQKVFQVINGEKEGGRQLYKWFIVSMVGQLILSLV